jgi:hypothetical protein
MKKLLIALMALALLAFFVFITVHPATPQKKGCTTIQQGLLVDSNGNLITLGYDIWGYNYQAHMFNGYYDNATRPNIPVTSGDNLEMKWNDAWLSNKDCDGDVKLDRHYGYPTYRGSGAWLTNHQSGTYEKDGKTYHWTYFIKIIAAPADAYSDGGVWYTADGMEIGWAIWGDFAVIQEVYNDPGTGDHGLLYKSPVGPGFGKW